MSMDRYGYSTEMFEPMERMMAAMRHSMTGAVPGAPARSGFGTDLRMERDESGFVVVGDIPGFDPEEIDLRFDDGELHLEAIHETSTEAGGVSGSRSRQIRQSLRIPGDVLVDEITASYRNGVLEVRLPIESAEDDDTTRIDID